MEFNEMQEKRINKILYEYCHNEEYRKTLCEKYDNATYELSILEIYILEEIVTYGNRNIYRTYITIDQSQNRIEFYDDFLQRLLTDKNFCKRKLIGFEKLPQNQMFIIGVILKNVVEKNNIEIYDPYNQILNGNEEEFKMTLKNAQLGWHILNIVDHCSNKDEFKYRGRGQFSKESKEKIIDILREGLPTLKYEIEASIELLMYMMSKKNNSSDLDNISYGIVIDWNQGRTNISFDEVYGKTKNKK